MSRISTFLMVLSLLSCKGTSDHHSPPARLSATTETTAVRDDQELSCDQLLSALVKSSNAAGLKHFGDTPVQVRLEYLTPEKAMIKLYVISNISDDPADKKLTENAVGWLEFHRQTGQLTDITNDPEEPVVLQYDTTLLQKHDLYQLCGTEAAVAKRATSEEQREVMQEADIRFNGQLKRFFTRAEFEKVFGKPDSIQLLKDEAPCISIFDTESPDDQYLYKDGSRFETSKDRVAVDEFRFQNGNFMTWKGMRIDANTTINDIRKLFPAAVSGRLEVYKEGELRVIQLKEDHEGISDGHVKLFFKNGKLNFIHWWFPC